MHACAHVYGRVCTSMIESGSEAKQCLAGLSQIQAGVATSCSWPICEDTGMQSVRQMCVTLDNLAWPMAPNNNNGVDTRNRSSSRGIDREARRPGFSDSWGRGTMCW
eukprot:GHVU01112524.1.p2 GENE.GHVU01112524.1~~GHVU01112524.1.p2  ORF type:complete len:107 (+),score=2.50 GHVU01112524.1:1065-1385(+)